MAVDLSMVGIRGQQAGQELLESRARIKESEVNNQVKNFELEQAEKLEALSQQAASALRDVTSGKRTGPDAVALAESTQRTSDPLRMAASIFAGGGAIEQASKLLDTASQIDKREADIENDEVLARQRKLVNIEKGAGLVGRWLGGAKNQDEWAYGLRKVREAGLIEEQFLEQFEGMEYTPEVADYLRSQAIDVEAQARLDIQASTTARLDRVAENSAVFQAQSLELQRAALAERERHNKVVEKASGGKSAAAVPPNSDAMKSANRALMAGPFKGVDATANKQAVDAATDYIASQALAITKQNKALTWDQAVQRAMVAAEASGALSMVPGKSGFMGFGSKPAEAEFDPSMGKTAARPLSLFAKDGATPMKKEQLLKGRYYSTPKGVLRWDGQNFTD